MGKCLVLPKDVPLKLRKVTAGSKHWLQKKGRQREEAEEKGSQEQAVHREDRGQPASL